jgi:hypothetical protein
VLSSFALLVFPPVLLVVYRQCSYFDGHPIEQTIPSFGVFLGLAVLVLQPAKLGHPEGIADEGNPLAHRPKDLEDIRELLDAHRVSTKPRARAARSAVPCSYF